MISLDVEDAKKRFRPDSVRDGGMLWVWAINPTN
jgi:hypothetical protein